MRARWSAIAAVVLLGALLGGCQVAVSGTPGISAAEKERADRRAEQRAAVEAALTAVEQAPALVYTANVKGAAQAFRVTRGGSALGSLPMEGGVIQLVAADTQVYLQADANYWKAHAIDDGAEFGTSWVRTIISEVPLQPSAQLAPAKLAAGLRKAVAGLNQTAEPVKTKLPDGTEVYELGAAPSVLRVTTAKPNRVVGFAPALLDGQAGPKLGAEFAVAPLTGDALKKFHTDLDAAVAGLGQPLEGLIQAHVAVTNDKLDCKDFVGSCTTTVDVVNSVVGASVSGLKSIVHIKLTIEISAEALGAQTCTAEADAEPLATTKMSCTVKFKLPNKTASYQVLSKPDAVGVVRAAVDPGAVKQKLQTEFAALGG